MLLVFCRKEQLFESNVPTTDYFCTFLWINFHRNFTHTLTYLFINISPKTMKITNTILLLPYGRRKYCGSTYMIF